MLKLGTQHHHYPLHCHNPQCFNRHQRHRCRARLKNFVTKSRRRLFAAGVGEPHPS